MLLRSPELRLPYLARLDYRYDTRQATDGANAAGGIELLDGKHLMLREPNGEGERAFT